MKHPLLPPAVVLVVLATALVWALCDLAAPSKSPEAAASPAMALPISKSGKPWYETDVVMSLLHEPPRSSVCTEEVCETHSHWHVALSGRGQPVATRTNVGG